ncbi:MAG: hypothetical protein KIT11_03115 [Fimbriimonadaceae bacterium]|nr:hypothetical protein [Fimbriimonadaceae bacterium]QYK57112.1 MAG: hypothetical protein KF733_06410 [Fimbriimonadaceae bacterium]
MREPVVADRYLVTWKELGEPVAQGDYEVPGLGIVTIDDADLHFATHTPDAEFFVRRSKALGNRFVVVSRKHPA